MSEDEVRLDELLGAYALDAVSDEERREVEQYLAVNPRARAEVAAHREVATMLAWSGTPAPDGLWERIAGQLESEAPKPSGELAAVLAFDPSATRTGTARTGASRRRPFARGVVAWIGAAAAAAIVAVLAVGVLGNDDGGTPLEAAVDAARSERDSATATLRAPDGRDGRRCGHRSGGPRLPGRRRAARAPRRPDLPAVGRDRRQGDLARRARSRAADRDVHGRRTRDALVITNEVAGGVISDGNPQGAFVGDVG